MKRVAFCTLGCRLNQYDTETVRTLVEGDGDYRTVGPGEEADVYVVNTCSVTSRADASARKTIRRIRKRSPEAPIVVTGCYAQRAPAEVAAISGVSLVVGAADRGRIVEEMARVTTPGNPRVAVSPIAEAKDFLEVPITEMMERSRAVVKVQEGCGKSCTFCIIPQTRGRSRSRRPERVLEQVRQLVANGYREIVFSGVHVGDYGLDLAEARPMLVDLVREVLAVPGLVRFRLSSIEPESISPALIELMANEEKFARHFHIPLQSGADEVLRRMARGYTAQDFSDLITAIIDAIPGCGIGTDVICGFPGETAGHFAETRRLIGDLPITYVHAFGYSLRPGSAAAPYGDPVSAETKKARVRTLKQLSRQKARAFREAHLGQVATVLLEHGGRDGATARGLTDNYLRVAVTGPGGITGHLQAVRLTGVTEDEMIGTVSV